MLTCPLGAERAIPVYDNISTAHHQEALARQDAPQQVRNGGLCHAGLWGHSRELPPVDRQRVALLAWFLCISIYQLYHGDQVCGEITSNTSMSHSTTRHEVAVKLSLPVDHYGPGLLPRQRTLSLLETKASVASGCAT